MILLAAIPMGQPWTLYAIGAALLGCAVWCWFSEA